MHFGSLMRISKLTKPRHLLELDCSVINRSGKVSILVRTDRLFSAAAAAAAAVLVNSEQQRLQQKQQLLLPTKALNPSWQSR
jgi:hypothetical protein